MRLVFYPSGAWFREVWECCCQQLLSHMARICAWCVVTLVCLQLSLLPYLPSFPGLFPPEVLPEWQIDLPRPTSFPIFPVSCNGINITRYSNLSLYPWILLHVFFVDFNLWASLQICDVAVESRVWDAATSFWPQPCSLCPEQVPHPIRP